MGKTTSFIQELVLILISQPDINAQKIKRAKTVGGISLNYLSFIASSDGMNPDPDGSRGFNKTVAGLTETLLNQTFTNITGSPGNQIVFMKSASGSNPLSNQFFLRITNNESIVSAHISERNGRKYFQSNYCVQQ